MSAEEHGQPSAIERAARQAAEQAARQIAKQALVKLGAALGAKGAAVVAAVIAAIVLVVLLIVLLVAVMGAAFQSSTAVWPVSVATDVAGNYAASGWTISSRYGWRDDPQGGGSEFHDGLDLANPDGACPFGYHCGAPSMFDGTVQYVGWDVAASGDPSKTGGGEVVIVANGEQDHQTIYAHLEPYRLYLQLQGRIDDNYGRYNDYANYQPIGRGPLKPDLANGGIEMTCLNDMPNFIPTRSGAGTVVFLYDRPATCTTTVVWGQRGGDWRGWVPDQPGARPGDPQRAELRWQTPIDSGQRAQDVALRFRAHLVPPPPPPPITDTATLTPVPAPPALSAPRSAVIAPGLGSASFSRLPGSAPSSTPALVPSDNRSGKPRSCETLAGGWTRCGWSMSDIPTERERFAVAPDLWIAAAQFRSNGDATAVENDGAVEPVQPTLSLTPHSTYRRSDVPLGQGGVARQIDLTPTPAARHLEATLDPPIVAPGATSVLRVAITGGPPASTSYAVIGMAQADAQRITTTLPAECFGTAELITCAVRAPAEVSIPLSLNDVQGTSALDLTIVVPPDGDEPELRQSLALQVVQNTPTPVPVTATPISTETPAPPSGPGSVGPDCAPQTLVRLPNVNAPNPRLIAPAAASFATVRAEIVERSGVDALAILADVLRAPSYATSKAGVLATSWHKAGRAIDLNQGGPFLRVAEGRVFRLYVNNVDISAIFEAHGWQRIPVQGDTAEWWHYEWHPDGIAWTSAMLQVWDLPTLQAAFPKIAWATLGCVGGSNMGNDPSSPQETEQMCVLGAPHFGSPVETLAGCGPPVRAGDHVELLDSTLGFVGLSGRTTGPHLHLGMKVRSYDGSWPSINICTPEWLQGRAPPTDADCFTDMADPLAFLPQAPGNTLSTGGDPGRRLAALAGGAPTPLIPEGAPYQLPPPGYPGALVFTPIPNATPSGQYWSPYADGGRYGGGSVGAWFCSIWGGWPWCS
jgi:murein DD-endopeptidase MepM/ murein hydrolase activator NlpD